MLRKFLKHLPRPTIPLYRFFATEAKLTTSPYLLHSLEKGPSTESTLSKEQAVKYYTQMALIRKMENKIGSMYKSKVVRGFCHLYSGQEAVAVGIYSILTPADSVITSYRCHAWAYFYCKQDPLLQIIGELAGVKCGCAKGKGGSMHMYAERFYGGNGIVGAHVPLGAGIALTYKYTKKEGCCVVLYGDGACSNGQVTETYNMAKLWDLPCIFVVENNKYGMGTSSERSSAQPMYYKKGEVIPGIRVDGMDLLSMKEATRFARDLCIGGKGPVLIEAETYRYFGHSMSDPGTSYRSREEINTVRKTRDPISHFREQIIAAGLANEEELRKVDSGIKEEIEKAEAKVMAEKPVPVEELTYDIYCNDVMKHIRLPNPFKTANHKTTRTPLNLK